MLNVEIHGQEIEMKSYDSLEEARAAFEATEADEALVAWEEFARIEVRAAEGPEAIMKAYWRCPKDSSPARQLALIKWEAIEEGLINANTSLDRARELYYLAPRDSRTRRKAEELWNSLSLIEARLATNLDEAKLAYERSLLRGRAAGKIAKTKWREFAMTEAQAATNVDEARRAYERAPQRSPARKFLEEKFFSTPQARYLSKPVDSLPLSIRASMCLRNENVITIRELCQRTESDLIRIPNFGRKSLREVREALEQIGLKLADPK